VFGFWDHVIPESRLFSANPQLRLALPGPKKAEARLPAAQRKTADDDS